MPTAVFPVTTTKISLDIAKCAPGEWGDLDPNENHWSRAICINTEKSQNNFKQMKENYNTIKIKIRQNDIREHLWIYT